MTVPMNQLTLQYLAEVSSQYAIDHVIQILLRSILESIQLNEGATHYQGF